MTDVELEPGASPPDEAYRYLAHAVEASTRAPVAVRLRMRGQIRLRGRWRPFKASQWLAPHRGLHWRATVNVGPLRIQGFDRYMSGRGEMRWRIFGLIPIVREQGPDIDRSARGRLAAEAIWTPGALLPRHGVAWSKDEDGWLRARWNIDGARQEMRLEVDADGRPQRVVTTRWGNPDGRGWRPLPFGGRIDKEATFGGITIPTRVSAGWWFGMPRYAAEGEFFRVVIEDMKPA